MFRRLPPGFDPVGLAVTWAPTLTDEELLELDRESWTELVDAILEHGETAGASARLEAGGLLELLADRAGDPAELAAESGRLGRLAGSLATYADMLRDPRFDTLPAPLRRPVQAAALRTVVRAALLEAAAA